MRTIELVQQLHGGLEVIRGYGPIGQRRAGHQYGTMEESWVEPKDTYHIVTS